MAKTRPTFSESWYRIASAKPRLRSSVTAYRQHFRGERWHVLQDPASNQYYRLSEPAYFFVALLDGRRSVDAAWQATTEKLGDDAPTQPEALQLLGRLYASNLLQAELAPDTTTLLRRYDKRVHREVRGYLMNLLFARVPIFDPDPLLARLTPLLGWVFTKWGLMLWLIIMAVGLGHLVGQWDRLWLRTSDLIVWNTEQVLLLYLCFGVLKMIHELGHGIACKTFGQRSQAGGEVHTLGVMFLVGIPMPYVDASSSWALRNKWQRFTIGAAGMYVELAFAAVAAVVWARTGEGTLTHALAYNVIFVASISTILFNANPLLRFDGYFMLSDWLEVPNLANRARDYMYYLARRYAFGIKHAQTPIVATREKVGLVVYGIASNIYRIAIGFGIVLLVANAFFFIGAILAMTTVIAWLVVPVGKFCKYLATNSELDRTRGRALSVAGVVAGLVVVALFVVPAPDRDVAEGVVEPVQVREVFAAAPGVVERVLPSGSWVSPDGEPLVTAINLDAQLERVELQSDLLEVATRLAEARGRDPALADTLSHRQQALRERLDRVEQDLSSLSPRAEFAGQWVAPEASRLGGRWLARGERLGLLVDPRDLRVRAVADQRLGPRLRAFDTFTLKAELRTTGSPGESHPVTLQEMLASGQDRLPSAALGYRAGGQTLTRQDDQSGTRAAEPVFELWLRPESSAMERLHVGQRVVVRFDLGTTPLGMQGWRWLRQTIQQRWRF